MRPGEMLVVNNAKSWDESDYNINNFEKAAEPLCHEVEKRQREGISNVTLFYGAWVKQKNGTYVNVYMACCYPCLALSKFQWLGWLMAQYTIRHESSLTSETDLVYRYHDRYLFQHEFLYRMNVSEGKIGNCIDHSRRIRPVTHHNYVCFVAVHDRLSYQNMFARATAPKRESEVKRVKLGGYNAAWAKYLNNIVCNNTISPQADSKCIIRLSSNYSYDFECCCYGINGAQCQDNITKALNNGENIDFIRGAKKACALEQESHPLIEIKQDQYGVTYSGTMDDVLQESMQFEFCELHLTGIGTTFEKGKAMKLLDESFKETLQRKSSKKPSQKRVRRYNGLIQLVTTNTGMSVGSMTSGGKYALRSTTERTDAVNTTRRISITEDLIKKHILLTKSLNCENISTWDHRELDILPFRCVELLPIDAQCPFDPPEDSDHHYVKCCCTDRSFCNYAPDLSTKRIESIQKRCKYSNVYQNFVDAHMYPLAQTSLHTCLMHFANYEMLSDIYGYDAVQNTVKQNLTRMFILPGSALSPVDFSYALLQPGTCGIIDVHIRTHMCAKYSEERIAFLDKKLVVNYASPFCVTYLQTEFSRSGMHYFVRSNALMRTSKFYRMFHIDTLAYIMYAMTNEFSSNCMAYGKGVICVCHDLDLEPSEDVCNGYMQRIRALRLAIHENIKYSVRKFVVNLLYNERFGHAPKLCPTSLTFATVRLMDDNVFLWSECAHKTPSFFTGGSASLFCVEFLVDDECIMHINNQDETEQEELVCCCIDCDLTGIFISEIQRQFENLFELRGRTFDDRS